MHHSKTYPAKRMQDPKLLVVVVYVFEQVKKPSNNVVL